MFLIKIKNTIHGKCILYSSKQGGQTTRFFTRFLHSEKSREKSSRLAEALVYSLYLTLDNIQMYFFNFQDFDFTAPVRAKTNILKKR